LSGVDPRSVWFVVGLAPFIGSFLGVVIRRLPAGRPLVAGRSACDVCRHPLSPLDLMPVVSFLALNGRCRHCHALIDRFHLTIEIASLVLALLVCLIEPDASRRWLDCGLGWTLLTLAWIDLSTLRLPDVLTLPLLLAGLAATRWLRPDLLTDHAAAAAVGYLGFRGLALLYRRLRGREGLGAGDAKLVAALGAWVGLGALPWAIALGAGVTLLFAIPRGEPRATRILPFGPGLALAGWLVWMGN
jgi:leader peptidase (prepilin peptidase)/N-methyltransferase